MAAGRSSSLSDRIARQYEQQFGQPASAQTPGYGDYVKTALPALIQQDKAKLERSKNRWNTFGKVATAAAAIPFAAAAGPAVFGGGAAASGGSLTAPVTKAASKFTLGKLLDIAKIGVPAATQLLGMRSQNKTLDRQAQMEQANFAQQIEMARADDAYRRSEAERVAAEDRRRWEVEQANMARQLAAAEEDRAFNRRLIEEREGRRQQARYRLEDFLRMSRR